jgi:ABC-2 type transport system ATP-binding protein
MMINPTASAISARAVHKSFGEHVVLDEVDLAVAPGTIFALLGPNGAGKTTMVRILSTLIRADRGDIRVGGHDVAAEPDAVRARRSASPASSPPLTVGSPNCWSASTSPRRPAGRCRPTPAGCGGGSTWR